MKTIITFIAGALLASGLVYLMMNPKEHPQETAVAQTPETATPSATEPPPISTPEATEANGSTPSTSAAPASASSGHKPSAMPGKASAHTPAKPAQPAHNGTKDSGSTNPSSTSTSGTTTTNNGQQQQASNNTPAAPPYYDPNRNIPSGPPPEDRKPEPPKRVPKTVTIPAGTPLSVRIDQRLGTDKNKAGDTFPASLDQPLIVDGMVLAERGARVEGKVVDADPGGRVSGVASMTVQIVKLNTSDGQHVNINTDGFNKQAQSEKKKDAAKVGAAAGIGAAIGAIAGGGKGAGLGAIIGGAAGTGGVMATRGGPAQIPAETRMSFRLSAPVTLTERID